MVPARDALPRSCDATHKAFHKKVHANGIIPLTVGGDLVEVSPPFDSAGITAMAGADLLFQIFCVVADAVDQRKA